MATTNRLPISNSTSSALSDLLRRYGAFTTGALLFTLALALRLYRLGAQSLWLDEGGTWAEVTGKSWTALLAELWSRTAAYPLYHLLLKGWVGLAGDSEWALRFPSALAGAGAVVAIYLAARELWPTTDDRRLEQRTKNKEQRSRRTKNQEPRTKNREPSRVTRSPTHPLTPAATESSPYRSRRYSLTRSPAHPLIAALLMALSPFALWQSQDAKAYSLLILVVALLLWSLLRALRRNDRSSWLLVVGLALTSLFVHRLALLSVVGALLAYALIWPPARAGRAIATARWGLLLLALLLAVVGVYGVALAVGDETLGGSGHIAAGPLLGLWLTLAHFSLDQGHIGGYLGLPLAIWLLPCLALTAWGMVLLVRDAWRRQPAAIALLCLLLVPVLLFAAALAFAPIYESRYTAVAFPAWVLLLAYPFGRRPTRKNKEQRTKNNAATTDQEEQRTKNKEQCSDDPQPIAGQPITDNGQFSVLGSRLTLQVPILGSPRGYPVFRPLCSLFSDLCSGPVLGSRFSGPFVLCSLFFVLVLVDAAVLLQPQHGLFSGAPVKEQWREGIGDLARRAHPDDLVIVQPYYVMPMWAYYAPRVTPDPLPQPAIFTNFGEGDCAVVYADRPGEIPKCYQRRYERDFNQRAAGKKRMLMLIAPEHARTVDPPKTLDQLRAEAAAAGQPAPDRPDRYGWLGLRFQFAGDQRTWPCGGSGDAYIGVEVMCASFPESYETGDIPQPAVELEATFGGELGLRGYTIAPAGGALRPGGTLPLTLYWQAAAPPTRDYTMFLHLCRDCASPPLAQADQRPLEGYPPAGHTSTWRTGDPVHDERAIQLPRDLPPGRYMLLLGVYPFKEPSEVGEPSEAARLPIDSDAQVLDGMRLVLAEVEVRD